MPTVEGSTCWQLQCTRLENIVRDSPGRSARLTCDGTGQVPQEDEKLQLSEGGEMLRYINGLIVPCQTSKEAAFDIQRIGHCVLVWHHIDTTLTKPELALRRTSAPRKAQTDQLLHTL
jgi:hypothetical protein